MWKTVLFDLDGTLTDSAEGITKCVQHALVQLGHEAPELEDLNCFVGPPLKEMFMSYAGLSDEEGEQAVALYRERYVPVGMFENHLYPRIIKMLELFKEEGITMAVASSKPEVYVKQILEYFHIDHYFKAVVGSELGGARVQKKDVLEEALRRLNLVKHKEQVVLVGDTKYDVEGANEVGIACIGVTYGYGTIDELEAAKPIYLAESVSDVAECVLSQQQKPKKEPLLLQLWRIAYPVFIHLGFSSVLAYVIMVVMMGVMLIQGITFDIDAISEMILENSMLLSALSSFGLIPVSYHFFKNDEWERKDFGIRSRMMFADKFGPGRVLLVVVFFIILAILLNQLITWSGLHQLFPTYTEIAEDIYNSNTMLLSYAAVAVLGPIAEELIYRGLVYRRIRDYISVRAAIIMSALIFGIIHGNVVQFLFAFLMGLAMAAVYERYKTIWAPLVAHVAVNLFSCIAEFAGVNILPASDITAVILFAAEGMSVVIIGVILFDKWIPKKAKEEIEEVQ